MMKELKRRPVDVQMLKNFEHDRLDDSDSEEEDKKKSDIGTTRLKEEQQAADSKVHYREAMMARKKETPMNFIDSFHF